MIVSLAMKDGTPIDGVCLPSRPFVGDTIRANPHIYIVTDVAFLVIKTNQPAHCVAYVKEVTNDE